MQKLIRQIKSGLSFFLGPIKQRFFQQAPRKRALYTAALKKKIKENVIFYEAYHGRSMTGNPYALFKYLLEEPHFKDFIHVWAVRDETRVPKHYKNYFNIVFINMKSVDYVRYLATAKYLINNTTFPTYFQKRKEQIYINTWHGTPLKKMGIDLHDREPTDHQNIQRNLLHTNYFISPSAYTTEKIFTAFDAKTLFQGEVLEIGSPRIDLMFQAKTEQIKKQFSLPKGKKIILYAPTWRDTPSLAKTFIKTARAIQAQLGETYYVLLKAHYYVEKEILQQENDIPFVAQHYDTNELLSVVDLLITDYSSIFFDFLPTKKPIVFYPFDAKAYEQKRGLYIDLKHLPGPVCKTFDELLFSLRHLSDILPHYKERYEQFRRKYCKHEDGLVAKRFVDFLFHHSKAIKKQRLGSHRTKILMYGGGFLNNGITSSVISLLNYIDYERYDVTLIDYGRKFNKEKEENIKKVPPQVHYIYRSGGWNATLFDLYRHRLILWGSRFPKFFKRLLPSKLYQREFQRMVGITEFDIGIDFSGYSPFWALFFAFGTFKKRAIYLHSDMQQELNKSIDGRFPHRKNLQTIFLLYSSFNDVLSVSALTYEKNKRFLKPLLGNVQGLMNYVVNPIDYRRILSLKKKTPPLSYAYEFGAEVFPLASESQPFPWPNPSKTNFITIGRLGPEKDHAKLINAFWQITQKYPETRLYIVGDGALKEKLQRQIKQLHLKERVFLTGHLDNPYALLAASDCFVLSSNYEGQPIVLLEALTLQKPIIVTNVPGSRSVIEGGYGLIVKNSVKGLTDGMERFLQKENFPQKRFNYEAYANYALNMFYKKVGEIDVTRGQ